MNVLGFSPFWNEIFEPTENHIFGEKKSSKFIIFSFILFIHVQNNILADQKLQVGKIIGKIDDLREFHSKRD